MRYEGELVVSTVIDTQAERHGDRVAVSMGAESVTYAQLADSAARMAGTYHSLGVAPGDRIATMLDSSPDYLPVWLGSTWAGAIEVPVNTEYRGAFLEHVLRQSGSSILVIDARWLDRLNGLDLPDLRAIIVRGECDTTAKYRPVMSLAEAVAAEPAARVARQERDPVYILYTSGTTGMSKGAVQSNRAALVSMVLSFGVKIGLTHEDVVFSMFPFFHGTGRNSVCTATWFVGGRVELKPRFSVRTFWSDIETSGSTVFVYMGGVLQWLYGQEPSGADAENPIRLAYGGGAPRGLVPAFERRFGLEIVECYGSTELGAAAVSGHGRQREGSCGLASDHLEIEIQDENDESVPAGTAGQIVARPRAPFSIFSGYWGMPEESLEAFQNLWFHSGDRGIMDEDGFLFFVDRVKDCIRRHGENISSFEIERAVNAHPEVLESAAVAISQNDDEEVMIVVVAKMGASIDPADFFHFCIDALPRFAVPKYLRFVEALLRTPSERVQKYLLRDQGVTGDTHDRDALGIVIPRD
jgi:crotonobetaine/carnitine-CoA ligase